MRKLRPYGHLLSLFGQTMTFLGSMLVVVPPATVQRSKRSGTIEAQTCIDQLSLR